MLRHDRANEFKPFAHLPAPKVPSHTIGVLPLEQMHAVQFSVFHI